MLKSWKIMQYYDIQFVKSCAQPNQWPNDDLAEVCFVGRSNVGKSSFINALTNRHQIAKTANRPGKTILLNFFWLPKEHFRLVDAPGYGYSKTSRHTMQMFHNLMSPYLAQRANLKLIFLLCDIRHQPSKDDLTMFEYLNYYAKKYCVVLTKSDKLSKMRQQMQHKYFQQLTVNKAIATIVVSSMHKTNLNLCWEYLRRELQEHVSND